MICPHAHLVNAFMDGELPEQQREAVLAHLADCDVCRETLEELRAISRMVSAAPLRPMPAGLIERLEDQFESTNRDRGVLRIAEWLTTAAAAVLIVSLML